MSEMQLMELLRERLRAQADARSGCEHADADWDKANARQADAWSSHRRACSMVAMAQHRLVMVMCGKDDPGDKGET